jgi:hypothetical protein
MANTLLTAVLLLSGAAHAFCGFYVAGGGAELFNNATQVVLLRDGTRTVLSMQNNYQGPPADFAMVIPVPVVLKKENVKTLPKAIFAKLDTLTAPRLVEYWEQDPCAPPGQGFDLGLIGSLGECPNCGVGGFATGGSLGVKVEAKFEVGEYEIVILSAKDALGLETWLTQEKYKIPEGAAPLFRPYVQQGMKFFVARVNVQKVTFTDGMAQLSPLRFHYDSEKFELPVRLGLINAKEKQDLIVHVLGRAQRYEVANYPNVTIPTNIDLQPSAKSEFPFFYVSLFDRTLAKTPTAVVTEYAWDSSSCDPCPGPTLDASDLATLGTDVTKTRGGFIVTRLHARYDKTSLGEDLVFRAARPIAGGREFLKEGTGLEKGSVESPINNFQGRYAIRYPWKGEVKCKDPRWAIWGGDPKGGKPAVAAAPNTALSKRDPEVVPKLAESEITELGIKGLKPHAGVALRKK